MQTSASTDWGLAGMYLQGCGKHILSECKISTPMASLGYTTVPLLFFLCHQVAEVVQLHKPTNDR